MPADFDIKSPMSIAWSSLTCTPSDEAVVRLAESWGWILREPFVPLLFSVLGDVFLERDSGGVWWLNTGTGDLTQVAKSVSDFRELLDTELVDEWFMPSLVERLHAAGKIAGPGQCYTYITLPVFSEGKYEVANLNPVDAHEHSALTGHILHKIQSFPDGTKVKINVAP
ncbi:MAG: T6SS immunity protein Tdi1 domain-containing protein [Pseudomonadota bacterium]